MERRADPGAHRFHLPVQHPAGAVDHVRAVHQPHAATGGPIEKPWQTDLDAEILVPGVGGEDWLADLTAGQNLARADPPRALALAVRNQEGDPSTLNSP